MQKGNVIAGTPYVPSTCIRTHTAQATAYVSIRQHTSAYVSIGHSRDTVRAYDLLSRDTVRAYDLLSRDTVRAYDLLSRDTARTRHVPTTCLAGTRYVPTTCLAGTRYVPTTCLAWLSRSTCLASCGVSI
jgi:hypothetical protein